MGLQPVVSGENEYAMRLMMRVCIVLGAECSDEYLDAMLAKLVLMLQACSKNPSKPNFNHYLFETLGVLIRGTAKKHSNNPEMSQKQIAKFEANLFPIFNYVLEQDITEFIPYEFQLISLMLEMHDEKRGEKAAIPQAYLELFPFLLMPVLWERPGYVPALVKLLQSYIKRAGDSCVSAKILPVLGVFQRLIASKTNDHFAFHILNSLIEHMRPELINEYIKQIMLLLFQRLNASKTTKLVKNMIVFMSLYAYKFGVQTLTSLVDELQPGMFMMCVEKLFVQDLQKVSGEQDRKICAVGAAKLLGESEMLLAQNNEKAWCLLLESLVGLFELPEDTTTADDEHFVDVDDTPGYTPAFNQLSSTSNGTISKENTAGSDGTDPFQGQVPSAKYFLAKTLEQLSQRVPQKLPTLLAQVSPAAQQHLQVYFREANVAL